MRKFFARLWKEQRAQDLTEYALLLVLLALSAVGTTQKLAAQIKNVYTQTSSTINSASDSE